MLELVEDAAHAGDVGAHAGRGLVVRDQHGLDRMRLVGFEAGAILIERHALAPFRVDGVDGEAEALAQVDPEQRELAEHRRQHLVAGRQRVGDGGFPAAGAGAGEDDDLARFGLKDLLQVGEERQRELREVRRAVILQRDVHRLADAERHVGRAGNV